MAYANAGFQLVDRQTTRCRTVARTRVTISERDDGAQHSSRVHIEQVTREDALAWRAEELSRCQSSTVKNRLRLLNGLFNVAEEEG